MTPTVEYKSDQTAAFIITTDMIGGAHDWIEYPAKAIRWAVQAIELNLMDPNEAHSFMKDLEACEDMSPWI